MAAPIEILFAVANSRREGGRRFVGIRFCDFHENDAVWRGNCGWRRHGKGRRHDRLPDDRFVVQGNQRFDRASSHIKRLSKSRRGGRGFLQRRELRLWRLSSIFSSLPSGSAAASATAAALRRMLRHVRSGYAAYASAVSLSAFWSSFHAAASVSAACTQLSSPTDGATHGGSQGERTNTFMIHASESLVLVVMAF